jgi:Transglutaminase-like superfamily
MSMTAASDRALGIPVDRHAYPPGEKGIVHSLEVIARKVRAGSSTAVMKSFAGNVLKQAGFPQGVFARVSALLDFVRARVGYAPDCPGTEQIQTAAISLCVEGAPVCIPIGDCDDLVVALATLILAMGIHVRIVRQYFGQGKQQHVLVEAMSEDGSWIPLDPSTKYPAGRKASAVKETYVDPLDDKAIGLAESGGAQFVGIGGIPVMQWQKDSWARVDPDDTLGAPARGGGGGGGGRGSGRGGGRVARGGLPGMHLTSAPVHRPTMPLRRGRGGRHPGHPRRFPRRRHFFRRFFDGFWWDWDWDRDTWVYIAGEQCERWGDPLSAPPAALVDEASAQLADNGNNPVIEQWEDGVLYLFSAGPIIRPCVATIVAATGVYGLGATIFGGWNSPEEAQTFDDQMGATVSAIDQVVQSCAALSPPDKTAWGGIVSSYNKMHAHLLEVLTSKWVWDPIGKLIEYRVIIEQENALKPDVEKWQKKVSDACSVPGQLPVLNLPSLPNPPAPLPGSDTAKSISDAATSIGKALGVTALVVVGAYGLYKVIEVGVPALAARTAKSRARL